MSLDAGASRLQPAQLEYLAIYNPSLGSSDDTLKDQIFYYHARRGRTRREIARNASQEPGKSQPQDEENEKLRQIGIAQGMVELARNFSSSNIDSIETETSRIVVHELESGWWILASITLTRLPSLKASQDATARPGSEYSAREVTPAPLLITQLSRANSIFLLHHAATLTELFERVGRPTLSTLLEIFWDDFVRKWDVLLHGNPAIAMFDATKLNGGGELGIGVGEEEWGSGEREVLEGFIDRTEGLMDLVVGRYGDAPPEGEKTTQWLGQGEDPAAIDGVIFTGKGLLSTRSLRTVSAWMEAIFRYGEKAYGVGQNPSSRPRAKRKRPKLGRNVSEDPPAAANGQETHPRYTSPRSKDLNLRRQAIENNAAPPGIPAPLVGQVERSLDEALQKAAKRSSNKSPAQERIEDESRNAKHSEDSASAFGTDNMMKYLKLGYGTAWTLNPKGLTAGRDDDSGDRANSGMTTNGKSTEAKKENSEGGMMELDPTPEVSDEEKPFHQHLEPSIGRFIIGLSGDLEQPEMDTDTEEVGSETTPSRYRNQRLFLRTLSVETSKPVVHERNSTIRTKSYESQKSNSTTKSKRSVDPKTSASASIDGARETTRFSKVRVAVYVHQPFIFVFLFTLHTPSLTMPAFYRSIHNQLGPLQKPLLKSTDPINTSKRIASNLNESESTQKQETQGGNAIYDLIYDSARNTVRASIPNIPVPGTLAAEGLTAKTSSLSLSGSWYTLGIPIGTSNTKAVPTELTQSSWTRVDALNVHSQILNTITATRIHNELEHTVKTNRGWWVLWMKVVPKDEKTGTREAFLVRHADEARPKAGKRNISTGPGKWLLRDQPREISGSSSASTGTATAKGVSDGVGVDARKWIDGLLHLTQ